MYKTLFPKFKSTFDLEKFKYDALNIHEREKTCSYCDFARAVEYCAEELRDAGAAEVRKISLKADGKTAYMDYIMPEAWDIEAARLEIIDDRLPVSERLLADFGDNALCIGNRSAATPESGIDCEVVPWGNGKDIKDKIVFTTEKPAHIYSAVADAGGAGIISAYSPAANECPDDTYWLNGLASPGWYHTKEDRKIFCFSLTPAKGAFLAKILSRGPVKVHALVKSRIYDGKIYTVTGRIPGKSESEIALFAHIYEPFIPDDSAGAAALIAICRTVNTLLGSGQIPALEKSIRFVISMERYGFAQYFRNPRNRRKMLCGVNMDSICHNSKIVGILPQLRLYPDSMPFFGDLLLKDIIDECAPEFTYVEAKGNLSDDTFGSDRKIGVPTNWLWTPSGIYHHNSNAVFSAPDWDIGLEIVSLIGAYILFLVSGRQTDFRKLGKRLCRTVENALRAECEKVISQFERKELTAGNAADKIKYLSARQGERLFSFAEFAPGTLDKEQFNCAFAKLAGKYVRRFSPVERNLSSMARKASNIVLTRTGNMPFSAVKVPRQERRKHPDLLHPLMNWIDGQTSLYEILRFIEFEHGKKYPDNEIGELIDYFKYLEQYGYVKITPKYRLDKEDIKKRLRKLGVRKGDKLMFHSSLSAFGEVVGGAETVCRACMELLGENGVLMMPSFNHYQAVGEDGKGFFDPQVTPTTNGAIPDFFWRMKGVSRSQDPSHAFAVWGKNAPDYVKDHHRVTTMGYGSPLELLEQAGGKVVLIGCPDANTFMHVVEMTNSVPCLGKRTEEYKVKLPNGKMVKRRTWGWRDGACRVFAARKHHELMRKEKLLKEGKIGGAQVMVFVMKDFRKIYERLLNGKIRGVAGCKGCPVKPRKVAATVPSDWNEQCFSPKRFKS